MVLVDAFVSAGAGSGYYRAAPGTLSPWILNGEELPLATGGTVIVEQLHPQVGVAATGTLAFEWSEIVSEEPWFLRRISKLGGGVLEHVVTEGDAVPGEPGGVFDLLHLDAVGPNEEIAFDARSHLPPDEVRGLFYVDPTGTIRRVCRFGQPGPEPGVTLETCWGGLFDGAGRLVIQSEEVPDTVFAAYRATPTGLGVPALGVASRLALAVMLVAGAGWPLLGRAMRRGIGRSSHAGSATAGPPTAPAELRPPRRPTPP